MGDPLGSFLREYVSEDKACWKDLCWFVETVIDLGCHKLVSELTSYSTVWFKDEPSENQQAYDARGQKELGVIAGAQGTDKE